MSKGLTPREEQDNILRIATALFMYCDNLDNNGEDDIQELLETTDLDELMETGYLYCMQGTCENEKDMVNALQKLIYCLNCLETQTNIPTPVTDDVYDKVLELLSDRKGKQIIGISSDSTDKGNVREHQYPELRGSLKKVHFCEKDEIPKNDSRKSLEEYLQSVFEGLPRDMWKDKSGKVGCCNIYSDFKYDGQSGVFECDGNKICHILTRYKLEKNLGKDITHVFEGETVKDVFGTNLPSGYAENVYPYGVQVEIVMTTSQFQAYQEYTNNTKCNRRSAVSSILNHTKDNFDPNLRKFITIIPLQVSSENNLASDYFGDPMLDDCGANLHSTDYIWYSLGHIAEKFLWVNVSRDNANLCTTVTEKLLHSVNKKTRYIDLSNELYNKTTAIINRAKEEEIPIDGVVFTIRDVDNDHQITNYLGRTNDKNNFQVAFKFPAGVKKTMLKFVDFQVGPLGNITPVAEFEPITINGNTLSRVNLSNMDKLVRLQLHEGDEILIQYDIIPKIIVDESCKKCMDKPLILPIAACPICGKPLELTGWRCTNWECASKIVGRIFNYTRKMDIPGFGLETITMLHIIGVLNSIRDLYTLGSHTKEIEAQSGYGKKSVEKLLTSPLSRTNIYPHELLGSLGIPNISLSTMEKVCRVIPVDKLINTPEVIVEEYPNIPHVGEKTAQKIAYGIERYKQEILELLPWFTFIPYTEKEQHVVFHMVRDKKFERWLLGENGISSKSGLTDALALIVLDGKMEETEKVKQAKELGIPILSLSEAKQKWGYIQ